MAIAIEDSKQNLTTHLKTPSFIRSLDLVASSVGLLLLSPFLVLIALLVKLTSPGPALYAAERVGRHRRRFKMYKFRSMVHQADRQGPGLTLKNDARITRLGRFLRRTKLDELPQLINVFKGEMSIVGPRPEDPQYVAHYTPDQRRVLAARPGLTSPASVYYHDEEDLLDGEDWETRYLSQIMPHKLALDLAYLRQRSIWTDLRIIAKTAITVLRGDQILDALVNIRNRHIFGIDLLLLLLIPIAALSLRLEGFSWWPNLAAATIFYLLISLLIKLPTFFSMGLYNRYWRYAGVEDLLRVAVAVGVSTLFLTVLVVTEHHTMRYYQVAMYRTVPIMDGILTLVAIGGIRLGIRGLYHWHQRHQRILGGRRVLIIGAGESGSIVVNEMRANPQLNMEPVAFIDDDPAKVGSHIRGLPVLGCCHHIPALVEQHQIQRIIVAIPSAPLARQQEIKAICQQTGLVTHTLPGVYQILAGHKTISRVPQFDINQLLPRPPVKIDPSTVAGTLRHAAVLVTGAGGSIGSELCRQIARMQPRELILLGHGENSIFEIKLDLQLSHPALATYPIIADVRDGRRISQVIEQFRPDVIFHAAAHKHVPFMESNVVEAVTTNILGTENLLKAAEQHGAGSFVLISTDKAVNPTSIMGATKRLAELLVVAAARRTGRAFMAVRFGNVLGTRGSVIPVFQRQIAAGGPLTVTHPEMRRYFMTIPEAVQLVLQATVLGHGSEIFVLDMGQPVRILDLAIDMIKMAGLKPGRDIEIIYSGIRPGEKLDEELFLDGESYSRTQSHKIFRARHDDTIEVKALEQVVLELVDQCQQIEGLASNEQMRVMLPKICYYLDKYQPRPAAALPADTGPSLAPSLYWQPSSTGA